MSIPVLLVCLGVTLGAAGEWLLYGRPGGVNYGLFVVIVLGAVRLLARRCERRMAPWVAALWGCAATLAGALALYDAEVVQGWGPWLCGGTLLLAVTWTFAGAVPLERFSVPLPLPMLENVAGAALAWWPAVRDARGRAPSSALLGRVYLGVLVSAPMLLVFTGLFCASDEVFARRLQALVEAVSVDVVVSGFRLALFSALALGLLRRLVLHGERPTGELTAGAQADPVVIGVALGLVNLLFATFLIVQAKYLFAGEAAIRIPGVTYAEYARRGFFELEAAAALVLLIVVAVHGLLHEAPEPGGAGLLSGLLALQTLGVAASAVKRMAMYTEAYGMSVLRWYACAGIAVLALLLVLTVWGTARGHSLPWLASRLFQAALVSIALVSLADVEGTVARVNLARARHVDVAYLASLSADVVPALQAARASSDPVVATLATEALEGWRARHPSGAQGWPSYNLSRARLP